MNKQQLANRIWASANRMRNKIDANEYKDYILGLIFYKFLSDTEIKCLEELGVDKEDLPDVVEDYTNPDLATLIRECQARVGFFIEYKYLFNTWLESQSFSVSVLSEALKSFDRLMSDYYKPVYEGIFKTLREGLSKLGDNPTSQTKALKDLIKLIKDIPTDGSQDYDVLGYVYEYLISNFAASAGKKAGEFYTPHEVAMIMSEIVAEHHKDKTSLEIYDPTSGSGSLLITIGKAVSKHIQGRNQVKYYAQELKENTYNLTRMNLVMRGIIPANIVTRCADTLEEDWPMHEEGADIDKPLAVDAVVSNPPYSQHWDATDKDLDPRFVNYGVAPKTKADYAFLLHELHHIKSDGILTIVMPHGVLFRGKAPKIYDESGNLLPAEEREDGQGEGQIRANLIEKNNIDAIIGLPSNIFFGTGIPTLIMVLKKNRGNEGVLIIDASKGFIKDGNQNRLRACDVKRIADTYRERKTIPGYSRVVARDEIRRNDYNLNIPRYVDSSEPPVKYDIYATMFGGIPNNEIADLKAFWEAFPSLRDEIFAPIQDSPCSSLRTTDFTETIAANADVIAFKEQFAKAFANFGEMMRIRLIDHVEAVKEVEENDHISDNIFQRMVSLPLLNGYEAFQILADHWQAIIGDVEIIQTEGFAACNVVEPKYKVVKKNGIDEEVLDGEKGRIMPFELVQQEMFADELASLKELGQQLDNIGVELEEMREAMAEDDELQQYLDSEKENAFDKKKITADAKPRADIDPEVKKTLVVVVALWNKQSAVKKQLTEKHLELLNKTKQCIREMDMKTITQMLELKWIAPISSAIAAMPHQKLDELAASVKGLADKYAVRLVDITKKIDDAATSLSALLGELTGSEYDLAAVGELQSLLKGVTDK